MVKLDAVGERGMGSGVAMAEEAVVLVAVVDSEGRESSMAEVVGERPEAARRDWSWCCWMRIIWRRRFCGSSH